MELPGSAYLYTLATLSMTFAGFSAVVIVLCQTIGREISGFHVVLMRLYIEAGLWAAGFCMLAPLLAAFGLSEATVWRATSAIIAMIHYRIWSNLSDATPCDDDGTVASRTLEFRASPRAGQSRSLRHGLWGARPSSSFWR